MLSFEEHIGIAHFTLSCDNYMRQFKHHNREELRQARRKKLQNIADFFLGALFMIDIILFILFVKKISTPEGKDLPPTEPTVVSTTYHQVEAVEVKNVKNVEKLSAEDADDPKYNILATYPDPLQNLSNSATFKVTHYCGCPKCCGSWSSGSESVAYGCNGDKLVSNYSIATDPKVIPYGTLLYDSEGNSYMAQDTGSGVKGYHIDLFVGDHQEAINMGVKEMKLYW